MTEPLWYSNSNPIMKLLIKKSKLSNIFILEDCDDRIDWFRDKFSFVKNFALYTKAGTALERLREEKFDLLFLDHDLEDDHYFAFSEGREPQKELTGLWVAEKLRETINRETECIIHSMNPVGASNMIKAHPFNTIHIPFLNLMESLVIEE